MGPGHKVMGLTVFAITALPDSTPSKLLNIYIFTVHTTYGVILFIVFAKHLLLTMKF